MNVMHAQKMQSEADKIGLERDLAERASEISKLTAKLKAFEEQEALGASAGGAAEALRVAEGCRGDDAAPMQAGMQQMLQVGVLDSLKELTDSTAAAAANTCAVEEGAREGVQADTEAADNTGGEAAPTASDSTGSTTQAGIGQRRGGFSLGIRTRLSRGFVTGSEVSPGSPAPSSSPPAASSPKARGEGTDAEVDKLPELPQLVSSMLQEGDTLSTTLESESEATIEAGPAELAAEPENEGEGSKDDRKPRGKKCNRSGKR